MMQAYINWEKRQIHTPTTEGQSFYYTSSNKIRIRTLCDGNVIETTINGS